MIQDSCTSGDLIDAIEEVVDDFDPTPEEFRYATKIVREEKDLTIPTQKTKLPKYLDPDEVQRLRRASKKLGVKHALLTDLLLTTGLRVSEAQRVGWKDITEDQDHEGYTLHVRQAKGNKHRTTPIPSSVVQRFIAWHTGMRNHDEVKGSLFPKNAKTYQGVSKRTLQRWIKKAIKRASLSDEYSSHNLRHTFATTMLRRSDTIRLEDLQAMLGHERRETTEVYAKITLTPEAKQSYREVIQSI